MSRRLELATGYKLYDPSYRFTAENYQIMNYGYGGTISLHMDATKDISDLGIGDVIFLNFLLKYIIHFRWRKTHHGNALPF